uniref:flavin reductase family protein n=1 Tax=Elioraea sp. TaxID=2185103 RepID=UPI003F6F5B96
VHYAARSPARMAFREEMRTIAGSRLTTWLGSAGARLDIPAAIGSWRAGRHLSVCGPASMIEATRTAAKAQGWPAAAVHVETFGAAPGVAERGFTIDLAQSRISIAVAPGENILDRLFAVGVLPGFDCRRGACGACLTRVVVAGPVPRLRPLRPRPHAIAGGRRGPA